jgi:hypothetical protein
MGDYHEVMKARRNTKRSDPQKAQIDADTVTMVKPTKRTGMNIITEDEFLRRVSTRGLILDPKYPQSAVLDFQGGSESRFWVVPREPERRPHFFASLIDLMEDWQTCYVWRHLGSWPDPTHVNLRSTTGINDAVELVILKGLGIPLGTKTVVEFAREEREALVTLLFSTAVFGWSSRHDLYVVPDHARQIIQTDHHDVVHASFPDVKGVESWALQMSKKGFDLPDEPPDWTFKRPAWMDGE